MSLVDGRPVLEHTIAHLVRHGVEDVVVNLHHLPEPVVAHFGDGSRFDVRIHWSHEQTLLGTAGGVAYARRHLQEPFLVWYGDNLSDLRLDALAGLHVERGALATIALHRRDDVSSSGIVGVDETGQVRRFLEKPATHDVFSSWVNAGIYLLEPSVLDEVPEGVEWDFGRQVFPALLAREATVMAYRMGEDEHLRWIDRPEDLARVRAGERASG